MDTARLVWQGGMPMIRQLICRGLVLGAVIVGSTGCETLHSTVRSNDKDDDTAPKAVDSDASKLNSVDSTDKSSSQPFFSTTRYRSAFSSFSPEAQQIEKDLGVY
jgi:hypothetical protein